MLKRLFGRVLAVFALTLVVLNTVIVAIPFFITVFFKLCLPIRKCRISLSRLATWWIRQWIDNNSFILHFTQNIEWDIELPDQLDENTSYMVISNHCSWADIAIVQWVFSRRIPLFRFFVKEELKWIPILGQAFWALDFPFMKRYSKAALAANPNLRGKDIETTKRACEKLKDIPVAILNFLEGTRFSEEKYRASNSPYRHLLNPKAGGTAFTLNALNGKAKYLLDITLIYADKKNGLWDMMCGRLSKVTLKAHIQEIPVSLTSGDYQNDSEYRQTFQAWLNDLWQKKDRLISLAKEDLFSQ